MLFSDIQKTRTIIQNHSAFNPSAPEKKFRLATVFLLVTLSGEPEIIFIQKAKNAGYAWSNQAAFPGGHVDYPESSVQAAFRELHEELAIPEEHVELIGSLGFYETINNVVIEAFAGFWDGQSEIDHDPSEISRVVSVSIKSLLQIHENRGFSGRMPDLYELVYESNGLEIWGVTARIVHRFLEIMKAS